MASQLSMTNRADCFLKANIEDLKKMDLEWSMIRRVMLYSKVAFEMIDTMDGVERFVIRGSTEMAITMDMVFTLKMMYIIKVFFKEDSTMEKVYVSVDHR